MIFGYREPLKEGVGLILIVDDFAYIPREG
jgi:hypothetical protein